MGRSERLGNRFLTTLVSLLLLVGCGAEGDPPEAGSPSSDAASKPATPSIAEPTSSPSPTPSASPTASPHPVSLEALMEKEYDGRALRRGPVLLRTDAYTQYAATYRSENLTISGVLNVPHGRGPHPALVLAHGYIDPAIYVTGQGLTRERDYLARAGYVTLHVDYRNHAGSSRDPLAERRLRLGYTVDTINAVLALRHGPRFVDDERIGLLGRSMGGGVVYNVLTVQPGLVGAAVAFAPVSSNTVDNFERWIRPDPGRGGLATEILRRYGEPRRNPDFWRGVSPRTYFDRVTEPLMIHHGTSDDTCPPAWTRRTVAALERAGKQVTWHVYEGEEHAFGPQWALSMRRSVAFFDRQLGG